MLGGEEGGMGVEAHFLAMSTFIPVGSWSSNGMRVNVCVCVCVCVSECVCECSCVHV